MLATFFRNAKADSLSVETLTLEELRERVLTTAKREKKKLPWLKLATFGTLRSAKNSLRHDANVKAITGIELDYDDQAISFDAVLDALKQMKVAALLFTSPSNTKAAPRWRIVAPTSEPLAVEMRAKLVARLNGFLKKVLGAEKIAAGESFTLSQSYYFGWVNNAPKPDHRAEVIEGDFIDQRNDLAEYEAAGAKAESTAIADTGNSKKPKAQDQGDSGFEAILSKIGDGDGLDGFNHPLIRAAASYVTLHHGHPLDGEQLKAKLREAINNAPKKPTRKAEVVARYLSDKYLDDIITSAQRKFVEEHPITLDDFVSVMATGDYLFTPTRELWPGKSVNACIPPIPRKKKDGSLVLAKKSKQPILDPATRWLDQHQRVEQISWAPGMPEIIRDRLVADGGWIERKGVAVFNLYRPPTLMTDDQLVTVNDIRPWANHLYKIYPDDADHIISFLAHRAQRPFEKINHNLLLGGPQGVGKDTLLEVAKHAIGPWNWAEINPSNLLGRFNGFLRSVILRVSEARDLGDVNRFALYEHMKTVTAAPPDVLRVDEKNLKEHYVFNCCGVITTTNHKAGGVFLPADDRRTYVAWTNIEKEAFSEDYWKTLWSWYNEGGMAKVAAFLRSYDLRAFNPKAPPKRTPAFFEIVASGVAPEEVELSDLIERMGNPAAVTLTQLSQRANRETDLDELARWIDDRDNRKAIPHKLEQVGYVRVPNPNNKTQGIWNIKAWRLPMGSTVAEAVTQRQHVYAKASLSYADQVKEVRALIASLEWPGSSADEAKELAEIAAMARRYDFNRY